jgi:uncharacterized membrane protein YgaE (UPF0421/DUF939 family)
VAVLRILARLRHRLHGLAWRVAEPPGFLPPLAVYCLKVALACGLTWWSGSLLGMPRPFNAVLAVIILMQGHAYGSLLKALEFLLGVAAGLVIGVAAERFFGISAPVLAAVLFVCLLIGGWLKVSSQGFNNQIAVSALLVLATGSADNVSRLWETVLGGGVGVVVAALLWPPNPVRGLRQRYRQLRGRVASDVLRSLELAGRADGAAAEANRRRVREHSEQADAVVAAIAPAEEALRWNPWHLGHLHDLSRLEDRLRLISYLYRTVRALARQAAEAPGSHTAAGSAWDAAGPDLLAAGSELVEAVERRLSGREAREAIGRGRDAMGRFLAAVPREHHAVALGAVLDDLLSDVEGWRPDNRVDPDRQLVTRILSRLARRRRGRSLAVEARLEFEAGLREARLGGLTGLLTGQRRTMPLLADVVRAVGIESEVDRGIREIPLGHIKGSESRNLDFDVSFLPRRRRLRQRWVRLYTEIEEGQPIPPIDAYQLGNVYFVKHGHRRVSVARRLGWERIAARVVEVRTRGPVGSDLTAHRLLRAAEYTSFLERTELDRVRPEARLACSQLGRYDLLYEHVLGHAYFLGVERGREVAVREAAASWYDSVYKPLRRVAATRELHACLPGWTDVDIYLALTRRWLELQEEGQPAGPDRAAAALLAQAGDRRRPPRRACPREGRSTRTLGVRARRSATRRLALRD